MPLISIIIRTRDEGRWIAGCLRKVQEQTVADVEVVVVDNGSRDRTGEGQSDIGGRPSDGPPDQRRSAQSVAKQSYFFALFFDVRFTI